MKRRPVRRADLANFVELQHVEDVYQRLLTNALAGDPGSISSFFDQVLGKPATYADTVCRDAFDIDDLRKAGKSDIESILEKIAESLAAGEIDGGQFKTAIEAIASLSKVRTDAVLEKRVQEMYDKAMGG